MYGRERNLNFVMGVGTSGLIRLRVERFMRKKPMLLATLFVDGHVLGL
jgi:hypothetical protein